MHGLINRSLQGFLRGTGGTAAWDRIARRAGLDPAGFEAMMVYPDAVTWAVLDAAEAELGKGRAALLEDLGHYLVADPGAGPVRRLLRFGGAGFAEFLLSLEDLADRARLAVPDLDLPRMRLRPLGPGSFALDCQEPWPGFACVVLGALRAMADDYGALVSLEMAPSAEGATLLVRIHALGFAEGRRFVLARGER